MDPEDDAFGVLAETLPDVPEELLKLPVLLDEVAPEPVLDVEVLEVEAETDAVLVDAAGMVTAAVVPKAATAAVARPATTSVRRFRRRSA